MMERLLELEGFDLDLVGYPCDQHQRPPLHWRCPFDPGCGGTMPEECPLIVQLAQVVRAPRRWQ